MLPADSQFIVVCVNDHPRMGVLLRSAKRKARELNLQWHAVYVETPSHYLESEKSRSRVLRFITQAEEMGAEFTKIEARSPLEGIHQFVGDMYADKKSIHTVFIGEPVKKGLLSDLRSSLAERVSYVLDEYDCRVVAIQLDPIRPEREWLSLIVQKDFRPRDIGAAILAVGVAFLCTELLRAFMPRAMFVINNHNISIIFLIACAFTAGRYGMIPSLVASLASFFVINYFYTLPFYEIHFLGAADAIHLGLFLLAAVFLSVFTSYTRAHAQAAGKREKRIQALYTIQRIASGAFSRLEALELLHRELKTLLEMDVAYFLPELMDPNKVKLAFPKDCLLNPENNKALQFCWEKVKTTGASSPLLPHVDWRFEPMITQNQVMGVLAVNIPPEIKIDASFGRLMSAIADQSAMVLERIAMSQTVEKQRISEEREKLRAMLLSSVSHDLKTPLASIIGSLSVVHSMADRLDEERKLTLTHTALDEAQRLDSFISNILDMTRLESGDVKFKQEWHDPMDAMKRIKKRLRQRLRSHKLVLKPPSESIEVYMDVMMTEQVLQNVLDNAAKYSPEGTAIDVSLNTNDDDGLEIIIRDHGNGIPEGSEQSIFDKYERLNKQDSQVAGTGLGLAISRAVMEAQGGSISVRNHPEGGAQFTLSLPQARIISVEDISSDSSTHQKQATA